MSTLEMKLQGVRDVCFGRVDSLVGLALDRMEAGHYASGGDWDDVDHLASAEEEAADWVNYLSGLVAAGRMTAIQATCVVECIEEGLLTMRRIIANNSLAWGVAKAGVEA